MTRSEQAPTSYDALLDTYYGEFSYRIINAMRRAPRACFLPQNLLPLQHKDDALPIPGFESTSSNTQPHTVAMLASWLNPRGHDTVVEIGTGTGWLAGVLSQLARQVISVEIHEALAKEAQNNLQKLGITNVKIVVDDGSVLQKLRYLKGKCTHLVITASVPPLIEHPLFDFLADNGTLVAPFGVTASKPDECLLMKLKKQNNQIKATSATSTYYFVPLSGEAGWEHFQGDAYAVATFFHEMTKDTPADDLDLTLFTQ